MKLVLQSAMVFFGTLMAAALVAWGEPGTAEVKMVQSAPQPEAIVVALLGSQE